MTNEDFKTILNFQGGGCGICGLVSEDLHVDHDHATNNVRGLLCNRCNLGLGSLGDSLECVLNAAKYLSNPPATIGSNPI